MSEFVYCREVQYHMLMGSDIEGAVVAVLVRLDDVGAK